MITLVMALQIVSAGARVPVVYEHLAPDVIRAEVYAWKGDRPGGREEIRHGSQRFIVTGRPAGLYLVAFFRADGRYLIDGPFVWPDRESRRDVSARWRRTIDGLVPALDADGIDVRLIQAEPQQGAWPACFSTGSRGWSCWGVAADDRGIIFVASARGIWWKTTGVGEGQELRAARWGRLIVAGGAVSDAAPARVALRYPVAPPAARMRALRLDTAAVADARVVPVSSTATWIAGDGIPPKAWLEVVSDDAAPVYMALEDVAAASPTVLHVALAERRLFEGRVSAGTGEAAPATLISAFRLIDPPDPGDGRPPPRRVMVTESVADEDGRFVLTGLGDADYELIAWHGQLGRAAVSVPRLGTRVHVRLQSSGIARGRVLSGGAPVEGVDVISVPDPAAFAAADDMVEVKGGDTQSGPDGRFVVSIAPRGGGELRVGGGAYPVKRISLPRVPVPLFDAGDVDLGRRIPIAIVIDREGGCDLQAAGPVGRAGLQILAGTRTAAGAFEVAIPEPGFWEFTLVCGRDTRTLSPSVVQIGASDAGREIRMSVR